MSTMPPTFHYFAYGSNLLSARLKERTPSARVVAPAVLEGHALRWHKAGADGSGKCDVVPVDETGQRVIGVVYEIALSEKPLLDAAEALGVGYGEREVVVQVGGRPLSAWLYGALKIDPQAVPYDWYKALVLGGAREHGFEPGYLRMLEAVQAKPDGDLQRSACHFRLVNAA
jgi:gamma-glutamylcyclotransferase